jgi:predicted MPP superfamily phosphohydrolase
MKVFINVLIIYLTLNIYAFWRGWKTLANCKNWRTLFVAVFGVEFILYTVGLIFRNQLPYTFVHFTRTMGATWILFLFYNIPFVWISDLIFYIRKKKIPSDRYQPEKEKKYKARFFIFILLLVSAILGWGNYNFNHPVVEEVNIAVNKKAGNIDSLRIVMVGDVHLGYLIDKKYAKKYVDLIMAQQPDLILFVGDIIDAGINPVLQQHMEEELRQLHAPLGVHSCTGNHEYRYEAEEKIAWLNNVAGIAMLRDSAVLIDSAFYIVGREDYKAPQRKPLEQILREQRVNTALPIIVLKHNPIDLNEEVCAGVDIALYGHTHRGQSFPANLITDLIFEVSHGYKKKGDTHIFVTSGLGLAGSQHRIGTQSEIVILNVKFE